MSPLPFTLPDIDMGFTEVKGVAYLDEEFLTLEVEAALFGEISKEDRIVKIEPTALRSVQFETGLLKDKIHIIPKTRELLDTVPGKHLGELCLKVWRKHRMTSREFVFEVNHRITVGKGARHE